MAASNGKAPATTAAALAARGADSLLAEFAAGSGGAEAAFAEVVRRYAAAVFAACLRVTKNAHDADDATQVTFLTLAVQVKAGKPIAKLGPWLQRVAGRAALDLVRGRRRRETHEHRHAASRFREENSRYRDNGGNGHGLIPAGAAAGDVDFEKLAAVMAEELAQLPARYRLPLASLYCAGLSRAEVARELGLTLHALRLRVHRGRKMLARRLSARGVGPAGGLLAGGLLAAAVAAVARGALIQRAVEAAARASLGEELAAATAARVLTAVNASAAGAVLAKMKGGAALAVLAGVTALAAGGATAANWGDIERRLPPLLRHAVDAVKSTWRLPLPVPRPALPPSVPSPVAQGPRVAPDRGHGARDTKPPSAVPELGSARWSSTTPAPVAPPPPPFPLASSGAAPLPQVSARPDSRRESTARAPVSQIDTPVAATATEGRASGSRTGAPPVGSPDRAWVASLPHQTPRVSLPEPADHGGGGAYALKGPYTFDRRVGRVARTPDGKPGPVWESLSVAPFAGGVGTYTVRRGVFQADVQEIGRLGSGRFVQEGGVNVASEVRIGAGAGGRGDYDLSGGSMVVRPPTATSSAFASATYAGGIHVGGAGAGALRLGGGDSPGGAVFQPRGPGSPVPPSASVGRSLPPASPVPASLLVRADAGGSGLIEGWGGAIGDGGAFVNNGRVVADGGGRDRELIFLGYGAVTNTIENADAHGTNGWFARNGGRLVLPKIPVAPGTGTYTWGEAPDDPTLDLVNSVRLTLRDAANPGKLDISLLDKHRADVPGLPQGHTFIGVWSIDTALTKPAGGIDLAVRYDDGLASELGLSEASLKLWQFELGQWLRINDGSFSRDMDHHILSGHAGADFTFFAVSAPEPGAFGAVAVAAAPLLLRRRRRG